MCWCSTVLFFALIAGMRLYAGMGVQGLASTTALIGGYFTNIHKSALPLTDYHAFYLFWWCAWSIMLGQFTSRLVGGPTIWKLLVALLGFPSVPIAIWFAVLYHYYEIGIDTTGMLNIAMIIVGITFVISSLDSLIRLYTDNLSLSLYRLGRGVYVAGNVLVLFVLTLLFQSQWLQIQWIGAVVVGIYVACLLYILVRKRKELAAISTMPDGQDLDFGKIESVH